ncbi:MAG TPA: hypothetical protein PLP61_03230 [Nocardioides sp.]|uniref:hypothetical protein n=1 Tax=Nocardioides sp. TaxID=35761 RepID=UPI002CB76089|nr:hypothetical protein [Nocardioides sp.]HQR26031.1 hypothetical protein [Nocardioides sp.]
MADQHPWRDRIHLGAGIGRSDEPVVEEMLARLLSRLSSWPPSAVELWLRVKNRDEPGMRTTLELQVPGLRRLVAGSDADVFAAAVRAVADTMVEQLNEASGRLAEHGTDTIRR